MRPWSTSAAHRCPLGGKFTIPNVDEIPDFIESAKSRMREAGADYEIKSYDIEECFPIVPKAAIEQAALDVTTSLSLQGKEGVWVPRARSQKPS